MAAPYLVNGMSGVLAAPIFVSGPNKLFDYAIFNAASATSFVSVYDSALAPTVGTTVPKYQVGVSTLRSVHLAVQDVAGIYFKDGVWVAATTTAAGSSAPDTPVVVSLGMSTAAAPPSEAYALKVLADGASNYWRLGETSGTVAVDKIGGANGTISGGVTLNQPGATSDGDKAMTFNGTTGNITVPNGAWAAIGTGAVSWECWLKTTVVHADNWIIDGKFDGDSGQGGLAWRLIGTDVGWMIGQAGTAILAVTSPFPYANGQWHHCVGVVTRGATDVGQLYIDGVKQTETPLPAHWNLNSTQSLIIGGQFGFFNGSLDEVAIYPVALTATQIANHYALRTVS